MAPALALGQPLRRQRREQLRPVLNHGELDGQSDLGSREAYSGRIAHGLAHPLDELLHFPAADFLRRYRPGRPAQNRVAGLDDFEYPEWMRAFLANIFPCWRQP